MLLDLRFGTHARVAGEELAGTVLLDFKELQRDPLDKVFVTLRGSVLTYVQSCATIHI